MNKRESKNNAQSDNASEIENHSQGVKTISHEITSFIQLPDNNIDQPVTTQFNNLTGWSAPCWGSDDALKLIQDRTGTGKKVQCPDCRKIRTLPAGVSMLICRCCVEEMK